MPPWLRMRAGERDARLAALMSAENLYRRLRAALSPSASRPGLVETPAGGEGFAAGEDVTLFVTTIGDQENFADCLARLRAQTLPAPIDIIDHVAPMSAAFQEMHARCRTDYYVQVDEDMILFPHAIETLSGWMRSAPANVAMICAPLWDCDAERAIYGLEIYRSSIVKRFPYRNTLSCEIAQLAEIEGAGYRVILRPLGDRS